MSSSRSVFLTGATGFIGTRVARLLATRGDRMTCLVRDPSRATELGELGATLIEGDVTDAASLGRGLAGADAAIHLAAVYDVGVVDAAHMERVNVEGTRLFLAAARSAGTARTIYVSTTVALGPVAEGIGDESSRNHGPYSSVYERTKTEAHAIARGAQEQGAPVIMVCPAYVYGPGDNGPGGRFLFDLVRKRVPGLVSKPAWFSFVHVDDVATGIVAALDRGDAGSTYVLSGEDATINGFAQKAADVANVRAPLLRFPVVMARATGVALDGITRMTGVRFPITRENVDTASGHRWLHSHAKAMDELDWHPRSIAEGLPETMRWVKTQARK